MKKVLLSEKEFTEALEQLHSIHCKLKKAILHTAENNEDPLINNQEFLIKLDISKGTAAALRRRRKIAYIRIGKKIYYRLSDVNALLNAHRRENI